MAVIKTYLALYNLFAALSWAYTLYLTASCYFNGDTPAETWATIGWVLKCAQTSALLECLHSLFRLVRSPLLTTLLQVASRIVLLWGFTHPLEVCQQHWSLFLMVGSWSSVEVPRYLFYFSNLAFGGVPNWLFWLRYNLFAILYPTGISGELIQVWTSLPVYKTHPTLSFMYTVGYVLLAIYAPCGPFMYSHMVVQRAKNTKKRYCPKPKVRGLQFPLTKKGDRSTTKTNRG